MFSKLCSTNSNFAKNFCFWYLWKVKKFQISECMRLGAILISAMGGYSRSVSWSTSMTSSSMRGWPKSAQRVPNREPGSLKLIPYREPRSLEISQTGTYQEPGTEPRSSGLNFLGQPRSNWFYREVTVFYRNLLVFDGNLLVFTKKFCHAQLQLQFQRKCTFNFVFFLTTHLPSRNNNVTPNSALILILTGV